MTSDAFNARKGRGRPKGAPNKVTRELRALAAKYTAKGVKALAEIAFKKKGGDFLYDVEARERAINMLLDRAHGKPQQQIKHGGQIDSVNFTVVGGKPKDDDK